MNELSNKELRQLRKMAEERRAQVQRPTVSNPKPKLLAVLVRSMFYRGLPRGW